MVARRRCSSPSSSSPRRSVYNGLAASAPNLLLAGFDAYFAWSGIVGVIHYFFLRVAAGDRAKEEYNRAPEQVSN